MKQSQKSAKATEPDENEVNEEEPEYFGYDISADNKISCEYYAK